MNEIALLGFGTVGVGVYEIINLGREANSHRGEGGVHVKRVLVRNLGKKRAVSVGEDVTLTDNFEDILNDEQIKIVVSAMGGMEPEYSYIKAALRSGRHVVTSNKEVVCEHLEELMDLAHEHNVNILFEGSVGGGIPIISSMLELLKINRITRIQGILNGTTNYILTKMSQEKRDFHDVLADAQALGFAEADPTADIEGYDVMRKICILASLAFSVQISPGDVHRRGISNITLEDINMADSMGYSFKYLAKASLDQDKYSLSVTPVLLPKNSVISNVNSEFNVILVDGDVIGQLCFMGKGAGKNATANAVVSDVLKILAGNCGYEHVSFDSDAVSYGLFGIKNEYYIRASVNGYKQFARTINLVADTVKKNSLVYSDGKVYFITEELNSSDMLHLYESLRKVSDDVFYARLEKNTL